jgi:hypothetical protein
MVGNIYITGHQLTNGANNRVVTATSAYGMNGEANLTFDGSALTVTGQTNLYGNGGASAVWGNTGYSGHLSYDGSDNAVIRAASGKALIFQTNHVNEKMRITSNGRVSINDGTRSADSATEGATLRVTGTPITRNEYFSPHGHYFGAIGYTDDTNTKAWLAVDSHYAQSSAVSAGIFLSAFHQDAGGSDCGYTIKNLKTGNALVFSRVKTAASTGNPAVEEERVRIDSSGRLLVNNASSTSPDGFNSLIQVNAGNHEGSITIGRHTANANGPALLFQKSRSGTATPGNSVLSSGDVLGTIRFYGSDGTDRNSFAANIGCEVDGTPGSNDMPGRLIFSTTADGSATSTERMRISKDGHVTKPTQFHIVVSRSGNQTGYNPSQGFGTGILYNSVVTTQGTDSSILDSSTGRITVPVAGIYFLEGSGYSSTAAFTQGWFTKNGSRLAYSDFMNNSGASQNFNSNGFHKLAANDTIGFKAYGSAHTSVTVEASIYHTWMRITLVG